MLHNLRDICLMSLVPTHYKIIFSFMLGYHHLMSLMEKTRIKKVLMCFRVFEDISEKLKSSR